MVAWKDHGIQANIKQELAKRGPVGISQAHRKAETEWGLPRRQRGAWKNVQGEGIITTMNERHMLGNKTNKKTKDRKESVLSTVVKVRLPSHRG